MSTCAITVRLALPRDAQTIALMSRDLIEVGLGWHYDSPRIQRLIGDPDTVAVLARNRSITVGFAIMTFSDEHAHLVLLAVRPDNQRRGVGRRLIEWLLESAATAGIVRIHLELRAQNEPARAFYRELGFAETTRVPYYYAGREPAIRMMRRLRAAESSAFQWHPPSLGGQ